MEKEEKQRRDGDEDEVGQKQHQPPYISPMQPVQREAYGGGLYGKDDDEPKKPAGSPRASETQSADGPAEATTQPKHKPPPSSGDRDIDITGQSYIQ